MTDAECTVMRNWQPGDVAVATRHDGTTSRAIRQNDGTWRAADSCINNPPHNFRPLVVIDAEDREQVERLAKAMHESGGMTCTTSRTRRQMEDALQAALRSFITPPRPEEPTGLGAVVEDEGDTWVRVDRDEACWFVADKAGPARCWAEFTAQVRVISEGWSE